MTFLFKSLITILPKADVIRLAKLSLMLVIIAFMEVFGLALISFLLVNLDNLTEAIQQLPYIDSFITFFQIPEASIINIFCISGTTRLILANNSLRSFIILAFIFSNITNVIFDAELRFKNE